MTSDKIIDVNQLLGAFLETQNKILDPLMQELNGLMVDLDEIHKSLGKAVIEIVKWNLRCEKALLLRKNIMEEFNNPFCPEILKKEK